MTIISIIDFMLTNKPLAIIIFTLAIYIGVVRGHLNKEKEKGSVK